MVGIGEGGACSGGIRLFPASLKAPEGEEGLVFGLGPESALKIVKKFPAVLGGNAKTCVAHFMDDAELVWDGELSVDGGANGLVIVGDGESEGFAVQTACDQILEQGGPGISGFAVAEEEPEDVGAPIGGQSEGGEEGLRVGCLPPEWQGDGMEKSLRDSAMSERKTDFKCSGRWL